MRQIVEYIKNGLSVLVVLIFGIPTERFDRLNGLNNDGYKSLNGKTGIVIEAVSLHTGIVRYSGSNWKATLDKCNEGEKIEKGKTVKILSVSGNTLLVEENIN